MMRKMKVVAVGVVALSMSLSASRAGDGVVALQSADASCPNDSGAVYVDCGNGTVTDNRTGLIWLANADCLGAATWYEAMDAVAGLSDLPGSDPDDCGLSDGSSPGEWRLPSIAEWAEMVMDADAMSCDPRISDDQGTGCWSSACNTSGACAFADVVPSAYWSSTSVIASPTSARPIALSPVITPGSKSAGLYVWPVRGGQ